MSRHVVDQCTKASKHLQFFLERVSKSSGKGSEFSVKDLFAKLTETKQSGRGVGGAADATAVGVAAAAGGAAGSGGSAGAVPTGGAASGDAASTQRRTQGAITAEEEDAVMLRELEAEAGDDAPAIAPPKMEQPSLITTENEQGQTMRMRSYQIEAMHFFMELHANNISGGILADEMGLGKTLQTISILAKLKETGQKRGVHLIIAPLSLLGQWMSEVKRWCPSLVARKFHGDTRAQTALEIQAAIKLDDPTAALDVIVTSYEICTKEKGLLKKLKLDVLVVDEAHRLKNEASQLSKTLRLFNSNFRLLLTGTPLQNNLHELWALLNFVFPTLFKESTAFDSLFDINTGVAETEEIGMLHELLKPFMLRRLKADVEKRLQPKTETKLFVGLSGMQKKLYKAILERDAKEFMLAGEGTIRSKKAASLLKNIVLQLRKVCNHPYLFDKMEPGPPWVDGPHLWLNSGKMVVLDKLLKKLQGNKSRVLIFSQMTRMLDIISDYCHYQKFKTCRIDGKVSVDEREHALRDFTRPGSDIFIFLLSTRAGGLGLNLAVADSVILYDSDWNPHADLQAIDRAHRIGQKGKVHVYRFVTDKTVDELICERAEKKLYLDAMVMARGQMSDKHKQLNNDALLKMVKFGADAEFKSEGSTITDDDIDLIISRGQHKTDETSKKLKQECKHDLQSFSMTATSGSVTTKAGVVQDKGGGGGAATAAGAGSGGSKGGGAASSTADQTVALIAGASAQKDPGLEGRAKEIFDLIDERKDIFARVPWIRTSAAGAASSDTIEAKVEAYKQVRAVPRLNLPGSTVGAAGVVVGLSTPGLSSLTTAQWKRMKEALAMLGFSGSSMGVRTITVTDQAVNDWPHVHQAVVLLQIAENRELNSLRSSKRTASHEGSAGDAAANNVAIEGVGKDQAGDGNYCYMWGLVDWTDPNSSKGIRLDRPTPLYSAPSIQIAKVACGLRHSVAISKEGRAYTMGHGSRTVLGTDSMSYAYTLMPLRIARPGGRSYVDQPFAEVACGDYHSLLLTKQGEVWSWGAASDGQLGRSYVEPARRPDGAGIGSGGGGGGGGRKQKERWGIKPGQVLGNLKDCEVVQIACGPYCSYAVDSVGRVFSWGSSTDGMLGLAESQGQRKRVQISKAERPELLESLVGHKIVKVDAGHQHMIALDDGGHVYACGFGGYGRLGLKDTHNRYEPEIVQTLAHIQCRDVEAGADHSLALTITGDVFWWGRDGTKTDGKGRPQPVTNLSGIGVTKLSAGRGFNFALTSTGQVWVWGQAMFKECYGLGSTIAGTSMIHSPRLIPGLHNRKVVNITASDTFVVAVVDPKASNSDVCSACREGGALLLCDTCPNAFHYDCLPDCIEPDDLPEGDWSCSQCLALGARKRLRTGPGKHGCFGSLVELLDFSNPTSFSASFEIGTYGHTPTDMQYEIDEAKVRVLAQKSFAPRRREITAFRHTREIREAGKERQLLRQASKASGTQGNLEEERQLILLQNKHVAGLRERQCDQWKSMERYHKLERNGSELLQERHSILQRLEENDRKVQQYDQEITGLRQKLTVRVHFGNQQEEEADPLASGDVSDDDLHTSNREAFPFYTREGEDIPLNTMEKDLKSASTPDELRKFVYEREAVLQKSQYKEKAELTSMQMDAQNEIKRMTKDEIVLMSNALGLPPKIEQNPQLAAPHPSIIAGAGSSAMPIEIIDEDEPSSKRSRSA
eukprot:gene2669-34000_t